MADTVDINRQFDAESSPAEQSDAENHDKSDEEVVSPVKKKSKCMCRYRQERTADFLWCAQVRDNMYAVRCMLCNNTLTIRCAAVSKRKRHTARWR